MRKDVRSTKRNGQRVEFRNIGVRLETKAAYANYAEERKRQQADVADAAFKALTLLPRDKQDALLEGRPLEPAQSA